MAPSDQADSELQIRLTAETAAATEGVGAAARDIAGALQGVAPAAEQAAQAAAGAMEKVARKSREAAEEVRKVGEHAKMSAGQLRAVAVGMAGMAIGAIGAWQENHGGRSAGVDYAQGALSGAGQGAMIGGMIGGVPGMVVGGLGGAAYGLFTTSERREAEENAAREAREKSIASMQAQVVAYERLSARTEAFRRTLEGLGNEEAAAAAREQVRAREVARREAEDERLAAAQRAHADRGDEAAFARASRERALNARELEALRAVRIEAAPKPPAERTAFDPSAGDSFLAKGWNLFGGIAGGMNDASVQLARESNAIARQQLSALNLIAARRPAAAAWSS